ncbi:MAG: phosphatase PAP2 family protein [Rhodothermia bacterium]|nr:phosphatase PAP2 family protein [Rhodothermia bacterium]
MRILVARLVSISFAVLLLNVSSTVPAADGQDVGASRFIQWAYQDAGAFVTQIGRNAPAIGVAGATVIVPSTDLDDPLLRRIQAGSRGPIHSYLRVTNELGGPKALPALTGVFAFTLVTNDRKLQDAAFTSLQSLIFAGSLSSGLKYVFGRYRPESGSDAYRFDSFSGHSSFPSGHTTAAFAIVTPWVLYYPGAATYGLFAISTGTAVARIAFDKHWPTDVLAGAALGFLTARFLTRRHQGSVAGSRINLSPTIGATGTGISLNVDLR